MKNTNQNAHACNSANPHIVLNENKIYSYHYCKRCNSKQHINETQGVEICLSCYSDTKPVYEVFYTKEYNSFYSKLYIKFRSEIMKYAAYFPNKDFDIVLSGTNQKGSCFSAKFSFIAPKFFPMAKMDKSQQKTVAVTLNGDLSNKIKTFWKNLDSAIAASFDCLSRDGILNIGIVSISFGR